MKFELKTIHAVGTRFNDLEGTGEFWLLNPNVVKSNFKFSSNNLNVFISNQSEQQCSIESH